MGLNHPRTINPFRKPLPARQASANKVINRVPDECRKEEDGDDDFHFKDRIERNEGSGEED